MHNIMDTRLEYIIHITSYYSSSSMILSIIYIYICVCVYNA